MATIDIKGTSTTIAQAVCESDATLPSRGEALKAFLQNAAWCRSRFGVHDAGFTLCYGESEALPAIKRSFLSLKEPVSPEDFGSRIARALQLVAEPLPTGTHNLLYPHFLLHGLVQDSVDLVVEKIINNARIFNETGALRDEFTKRFGLPPKILNDRYYFCVINGQTDDFGGLSLQLFRVHEPDQKSANVLFAKAGFFIDSTNRTAYVINVQGRKKERFITDAATLKRDMSLGREYARFTHATGLEPRAFVLAKLFGFLQTNGIPCSRAIRPEEHPMAIGGHSGFIGNYDPILAMAGMEIESELYRTRSALSAVKVLA